MLLPVFKDLIKPQWQAVLEKLKLSGGLPVSQLARQGEWSYMAVKQHCEELKKLGYLDRSRVPRTAVGRPEIFYSLSAKADAIFPEAGVTFTLEILDELKALLGDNMPDKLLFQYFQRLFDKWDTPVSKAATLVQKATLLANLRKKDGYHSFCLNDVSDGLRLEEYHNPIQRIFERYPRAMAMEVRMIEQVLGAKVSRTEIGSGRSGQPRIVFEVFAPGAER